MHLGALTRLRLAFLALGVLVLVPLVWLLASVEARLDTQRRLRHEVVAERIFDELERELTSVLGQGVLQARLPLGQRPALESWPPFVIGYVQRASNGNQFFSRDGSAPGDAERLRFAVEGMREKVGPVVAPPIVPGALGLGASPLAPGLVPSVSGPESARAPASDIAAPASFAPKMRAGIASQSDVLKNLNRAHEQRQREESDYR